MTVFDGYSLCCETPDLCVNSPRCMVDVSAVLTVTGLADIIVRENITHRRSNAC